MRIYPTANQKTVPYEDIRLGDAFVSTSEITGGRIFMRIWQDDISETACVSATREMAVSLESGQLYSFYLCEPVVPIELRVGVVS